ncbi:MAG: TolC family protein [Bacteroidales bacterium]|nr:MAG: TolC family protein [Bacteroidales bacterium]
MYKKLLIAIIAFLIVVCPKLEGQSLITLEKAMEIAGQNSPEIQISLLNLTRYKESLNATKASQKSRFQLGITPFDYSNSRKFDDYSSTWYTTEQTKSNGSFTVTQPFLPTDATISLNNEFGWMKTYNERSDILNANTKSFNNNLYISINQPLFTYNKRKLELKELELSYENANLDYTMRMLNLEKRVSQYFYQVYMAQMSLNIAKDELEKTQQSYDIITNKVSAGLTAKEQLYQAELNLMTAKSTLQNQEVNLENAKDEFKNYVGIAIKDEVITLADITVTPTKIDLAIAVQHALESRMELRQKQIEIENSQFDLIKTKALNEFKGDLNLSLGVFGENEKLADTYDNPTRSPKVSVTFSIPIFDWGEKKSRIKSQEAILKSSNLNLENEKNRIEVDIRKVYRNIQNLYNQIEIAKQNEKNAQLTYEINLERYRNGDLTSMDLKLHQNQLSDKKTALVQAQINYKLEILNLKIQSLYDFEKNQPLVPSTLFTNQK